MKDSNALKAEQHAFYLIAETVHALATKEKRDMTEEEMKSFDAAMASGDALADKITAALALEANLAKIAAVKAPKARKTVDVAARAVSSGQYDRQLDNPTAGWDGPAGFGNFAMDVKRFGAQEGMSENLKIFSAAGDGLSAGISTDGGVLIPPAFSSNIINLMGIDSDSLLAETDQLPPLPYGTESMEFPAVNETSRADGSRSGGIQGYWKAELTQMTSSKPTLKDIKFSPQELYIFAYVSDKLLRNAPQLASFLASRAADEINFKLGDSIINGTGVGMPRGILTGATDAPRVQIAKETNQPAATIVIQNLQKMYARMPARFIACAKWYVNQDILPTLMDMTKAVGSGGSAVFMPSFNIAEAPFGTIYGRPLYPMEYAQTVGTEGDIIFANLKKYGTMTRGSVEAGMSMHLKFDFNQTAFRFIFEADGQPWQISSLTPKNGSAKQSSIVTLATRA